MDKKPQRVKKPLTLWQTIANVFKIAAEDNKKINRNKVYMQFGVGIGSPIYLPKRKKLKGYQRNHKGRKIVS